MKNYATVKDKAEEWGLSSRHVQYLCRGGKIDGAIKRAEAWFIPASAPSPAKKTKQGSGDFSFVGTKRKIFYSSIKLFVLSGVDSVSLRDIADMVGIRQSTIYNHFSSKQEILDTLYDFYCHYYLKNRPTLEDAASKTLNASLFDVIRGVRYEFDKDSVQEMLDITRIIFQRVGVDSRAKEISKSLIVDEGVRYVEDVFNMGVESGRFAPFDTHAMAVFINSISFFTLYNWIIDPSPLSIEQVLKDEQTLYKYAASLAEGRILSKSDTAAQAE